MKAYDTGGAAYFATPPVNMIYAYHASLLQITKGKPSLEERFKLHQQASRRIKAVAAQLGMRPLPNNDANAANGMTAVYLPGGVAPSDLLPQLAMKGVVVAGGLHKDVKDKYIRIGHMGTSVVDPARGDIEKISNSLRQALHEAKTHKGS